jgi:hypothetical protein
VPRRIYIIIAFVVAIAATVIGWSQTLIYKIVPPVPLTLWFPLLVITDAKDVVAIALSLFQFPSFAAAFAFGIRRWPPLIVLALPTATYALLVGLAFGMSRAH